MSFHTIPYKKKYNGKESDSLLIYSKSTTNHLKRERASSFTSKGSITLEAAVIIPIFFMAILCMIYVFEAFSIQISVRNGMQSLGKELAQETFVLPVLVAEDLEAKLIESIGKERLDDSLIVQGAKGLDCMRSYIKPLTGEIHLSVRYQMEIPVPFFQLPIMNLEERLKVKNWQGVAKERNIQQEEELVYVTDSGTVYHKSLNCSYLELSIRSIASSAVAYERNKSGARYDYCGRCDSVPMGRTVYVTDYGNCYHTTLDCPGLKRTVSLVPLSEVNGLGGCSKCVY